MEYSCIQLFPKSFLNKLFNFKTEVLVNLLNFWIDAVENFLDNKLGLLDPLVCENSCHIRALMLCELTLKYKDIGRINKLKTFNLSLIDLIRQTDLIIPTQNDHKYSIEDFFVNYKLSFTIEPELFHDLKFLVSSHILTLTKKEIPSSDFTLNEKTDHEKILTTGLVHNKTKCLVVETQKELSQISCQTILNFLESKENHDIEIHKDNHGRSYLPQHISGKIVISRLLDPEKIIVLQVSRYLKGNYYDKVCYFFQFDANMHALKEITNVAEDVPCVVFAGVVNYDNFPETSKQYLDRLKFFSIEHLFEANFAAHPQFSGSLRNTSCIYNDDKKIGNSSPLFQEFYLDYNHCKNFAYNHGCTKENPSLLFLNHIYCNIAKPFIERTASSDSPDKLYARSNIESVETN